MPRITLNRATWLLCSVLLLALQQQAAAQAGHLDPTFGNGGIVTTDFGDQMNSNVATADGVVLQSDGKIVVCGGVPSHTGFPIAAVGRYNPNGTLDSSFGTAGIATTSSVSTLTALALQSDGKIVAIGSDFVVRYLSNGVLDSTFGTGGILSLGFFVSAPTNSVLIQPDGKILVANRILLRFLSDGEFDAGFGNAGEALVAGDAASGLALLPSGKILVSSYNSTLQPSGYITQYEANGTLDTTFGINGQLASAGPANALVLLSSGNFLSGGTLVSNVNGAPYAGPIVGFAASRYLSQGVTDATFGTNGGVVTAVSGFPSILTSGLAVQPSGDIVILGTASHSPQVAFALARYTPAGQLDSTFGVNGTVITLFAIGTQVSANGLAIQADGKIVAAGSYSYTIPHGLFDTGFKIVRYLGQ